jgi:hypothetical protein
VIEWSPVNGWIRDWLISRGFGSSDKIKSRVSYESSFSCGSVAFHRCRGSIDNTFTRFVPRQYLELIDF